MKRLSIILLYALVSILFLNSETLFGQNNTNQDVKLIDKYLLEKNIDKADSVLKAQISFFRFHNQIDSLTKYPYYVGKIFQAKSNSKTGLAEAEKFVSELNKNTTNKRTQYKALLNLADFYDELGENQKSFDVTKDALILVDELVDASPQEVGKVNYNLGATALQLGINDEAKRLFRRALKAYESSPLTSKRDLSKVYNGTAVMLYLGSKLDSAQVYYEKAAKSIETSDGDPTENLLDATVTNSNVMLVQYLQGNMSEALQTLENVIRNYNIVIKNTDDENIRARANRYNANAITNLAMLNNEMGNISRANEIIEYAYQQRKSFLEPNDPQLATILVQIGQSQLSLQNYDAAIVTLKKAIKSLETSTGDNSYWKAAALYAQAEAYKAKGNIAEAKKLYEESEVLFDISLKNEYDPEFLGFLRSKALFLSENGDAQEAIETALKGYNYVANSGGKKDFPIIKNIKNIAQVHYNLNNYLLAKEWAERGMSYLDERIKESKTDLDSIQIEFRRPSIILILVKSEYRLKSDKNTQFLEGIIEKLDIAINVLEKRKTISFSPEEIANLLSEYKEVTDFAKQIQFDLYELTEDSKYLNNAINLHESSIYNRIRAQLNARSEVTFSNVPQAILNREKALKKEMGTALTPENNAEGAIEKYINSTTAFNLFLDSLRTKHPKYYKMRYATISASIDDIQQRIPENTTVVRYIYIEKKLYAFIVTASEKMIIPLPAFTQDDNLISKLDSAPFNAEETGAMLNQLYLQLWNPIQDKIKTNNVLIIPVGELFNLSFETLTPIKIVSFKDLAANSLLAKHSISYNYSLLLLNDGKTKATFKNNFISFAPEFDNKMKEDYKFSVTDSIDIDKTYLTLLSQPFTVDLAKKSSKYFKGDSFLNTKSTEQIFKNEAREHKIIHIGTHAESNNVTPELSRLIFAKNVNDTISSEDNSLYTFEIYNTNLSSNLAILTACETGKPTFQPGEGMISLAHAFNYAGSESMLTSLWKIDEKSSAEIIEVFYKYLAEGLPKNEALQKAKLIYLNSAEGRTLAPQYWAGLVLIGDISPIEIETATNWWYWIIGGLIFLILVYFRWKKVKS